MPFTSDPYLLAPKVWAGQVTLAVGDTLDFAVGDGGNGYTSDPTRLEATVTSCPGGVCPASSVSPLTPTTARLDVLQEFTFSGTGLSGLTSISLDGCESDGNPPTLTDTQVTFRCTPNKPGNVTLSIDGVATDKTVFIDHPVRQGDPAARGMPSILGVSLWKRHYFHQVNDMEVPGRGVSFSLSRSYNSYFFPSGKPRGGVDNYKPWRFNWELKAAYVPGTGNGQVYVEREDGSSDNFHLHTDGKWYAIDPGNFNLYQPNTPTAGQSTLLTRGGLKYVFESPEISGRLLAIADHDGNTLSVTYGANGKAQEVTDATGRVYAFTYWPNDTLRRVTDFTGRFVEYTWETDSVVEDGVTHARERLMTVRDVRGKVTRYNYCHNDPTSDAPCEAGMPAGLKPRAFLSEIVDANGNKPVQLKYVITYTNAGVTATGDGTVTQAMDAVGSTWHFASCSTTDAAGTCGSDTVTAVGYKTTVNDPFNRTKHAHFDNAGRFVGMTDERGNRSVVTPKPTTEIGLTNLAELALPVEKKTPLGVAGNYATSYSYTGLADRPGLLATRTDAENGLRQQTWTGDASQNIHKVGQVTTPGNLTHNFTYTPSGSLASHTAPNTPATGIAYDTNGQATQRTDARGNPSNMIYDANGNLTRVTDALGYFEQYEPDALGRVIRQTDKRGKVTTTTYDAAGNVLSVTDPLNQTAYKTYDDVGNLATLTDKRGNVTQHAYDAANRLSQVSATVGGLAVMTAYGYDPLGRVVTVSNPNLHASGSAYDAAGNVIAESNAVGSTQYEYDADNRVTRVIDPENRQTTYSYDRLGRTTQVTTAAGTQSYTYAPDGRVQTHTDLRGNVTAYSYDGAGRLHCVDTALTSNCVTHDSNGNIAFDGGLATLAYDELNREVSRTHTDGRVWTKQYDAAGNLVQETAPGGLTTSYTYDDAGQLSQIGYSNGKTVAFTFDANGNRLSMSDESGTTNYVYDELNRLTQVTNPQGKVVTYAYDAASNRTAVGYPGGLTVSYVYDQIDRLVALNDGLGNSSQHTLDKTGRMRAILNGNGTRADMTYDNAGRLTRLTNKRADGGIISDHQLTLDGNGNVVNNAVQLPLLPLVASSTQTLTYDLNRLATINGSTSIAHDPAGRMTLDRGNSYTWDVNDRITQVNGYGTDDFLYNGDGTRIARTLNGQTTRYVIDPNAELPNVLAETDGSGNTLRRYVHGNGLAWQLDAANNAHYYHFDPTGHTLALSNVVGNVSDSYAYTPYGETTVNGGTVNPFRFVGKYGVMDDGNGMNYMRARYYRPDIGQFLSLDKLTGSVMEPQTLNRYAYVGGNPISGIDPSGYFSNPLNYKISNVELKYYIKSVPRIPAVVNNSIDRVGTEIVTTVWRDGVYAPANSILNKYSEAQGLGGYAAATANVPLQLIIGAGTVANPGTYGKPALSLAVNESGLSANTKNNLITGYNATVDTLSLANSIKSMNSNYLKDKNIYKTWETESNELARYFNKGYGLKSDQVQWALNHAKMESWLGVNAVGLSNDMSNFYNDYLK